MIYLVCYTLSTILVYLAKKAGNKTSFIPIIVTSIIITSLLAGLRGITLGTDTINYYKDTWRTVQFTQSKLTFIEYYISKSRNTVPEILFGLLARFAFVCTGSYNFFMFLCHSIIISNVYVGAFRLKEHAEPEIVIWFFYLLYFGQSFNITRQFMAMAIIFAFVADLEQRRYMRYAVAVLICILIHNTAVLGLIPLVIHYFLHLGTTQKKNLSLLGDNIFPEKKHIVKRIFLCCAIVFAITNVVTIISSLVQIGLLSQKYLWYIDSAKNNTSTNIVTLLFLAVEFIGLVLFWKDIQMKNREFDFYFVCSVTFVVLNSLGSVMHYGDRLSEYFSFLNLITVGSIERYQKIKGNHFYMKIILLIVALVYWCYVYVYRNSNFTMPYYIQIYN